MTGFFRTRAAPHHYRLQLRTGSGHHELIRPNKYRPRSLIKCCSTARGKTRDDYYQVLGVTVHSTPQEIKEVYRRLQKQRHPDIAGYKGYDYSLLLNEAYVVLMRNSAGNAGNPRDVFAAAKNLAKKLERQEQELERELRSRGPSGDEGTEAETEAQAEARHRARQDIRWQCHVSTKYFDRG